MSSNIKQQVQEFGLTEVWCAQDPQVDVVLVHGLNGHPYNTWATHNPDVFWPADLLPENVEEQHCRILTYGYDANVTAFTDGTSKDHVHNHAEHLAARLVANRSVKARERPIIFVAHSLGGLVVKRLLIYCESINNPKLERLRSIYVSTFGILFLGTPHNGSDLAKWGSMLQSICAAVLPKKFFDSSPQLVNALKTNNETLQNINRLFIEIIEPLRIYFFHESKPTDLKGTKQFIVDEDSAAPTIQGVERMGIEKDHSHMCKFENRNAPGFDVVADAISSYAEEAPAKVKGRWERERRIREYHRQSIASELLGDSLSTITKPRQSSESIQESQGNSMENSVQSIKLLEAASSQSSQRPPRVAPLLFRPNSIFVGFERELPRLERKLKISENFNIGTRTVLICGPPGSGKSHLARQYFWTHQADYPAGTFWVDCKSRQSIKRWYWEIGQALGCLDGERSNVSQTDDSFVREVREALNLLSGWLIVFDGIFFEFDEALTDFIKFIPDSPSNCVIYTSRDSTLKRRHRLLNPSPIKLVPLRSEAACELVFRSLDLHKPTSTQRQKAQELVKYYNYLPLGIHAAANMLRAQGRALEKFQPGTSDQRLAHPFLEIVRALETRGKSEAITLLVILSLLNHNVPVALLSFGALALGDHELDIKSMDYVSGEKRELDNTIGILLKYGLIERYLEDHSISTPDRTKTSPQMSRTNTGATMTYSSPAITPLPLNLTEESTGLELMIDRDGAGSNTSSTSVSIMIDTLRIHTVTQSVIRQEVETRGMLNRPFSEWLVIVCHFLCTSYTVASTRLKDLPGQGSVGDYREYQSHISTVWRLCRRSREMPPVLSRARNEIRHIYLEIKEEIRNRSPSQSQSSHGSRYRVYGSVFENSASSPDEGPPTPTSDLTRASTWSSGRFDVRTDSPIQNRSFQNSFHEDAISDLDDEGYNADQEDLHLTSHSLQQKSLMGGTVAAAAENSHEGSARLNFLRYMLQTRSNNNRKKDLGEFRRVPADSELSSLEVYSARPRSTSSTVTAFSWPFRRSSAGSSASSSAEAALTAVQGKSPPVSSRLLVHEAVPSTARGKEQYRPLDDSKREPLGEKSSNTHLPVLTEDRTHMPLHVAGRPVHDNRHHARNASSSPRLVHTVLDRQARQAAMSWESLPVEDNVSISPRTSTKSMGVPLPAKADHFGGFRLIPSGYTSAPMSRDPSRESYSSLIWAPGQPAAISNSLTPTEPESYAPQHRNLPSIDVAMAQNLDFEHSGGWTYNSPFAMEIGPSNQFESFRGFSRTAPTSPNLHSAKTSRENSLEGFTTSSKGKEKEVI